MEVSILQWNVLFSEKGDNVLALIKEVGADIVCLQELTQNSISNPNRDLPAEIGSLGYHAYYEPTSEEPDITLGNGIFSKFPVVSSRTVYLTEEDPDNKDFPQFNRAYIESTVDLGSLKLTVGTAHLSYTPEFIFFPAKEAESRKFLDVIGSNRKDYVLTGDLNSTPDSSLIRQLDIILVPAGPDYAEASWTTKPFEMHGFAADTLDWRLDYVFTSTDVKVMSSEIVKTEYSDHLPILTKVEL